MHKRRSTILPLDRRSASDPKVMLPTDPPVVVEPYMYHTVEIAPTHFLESTIAEERILHLLDMRVDGSDWYVVAGASRDTICLYESDPWKQLLVVPNSIWEKNREGEDQFLVARQTVVEWPEFHRDCAGVSWYEVLDVEQDCSSFTEMVSEIVEDEGFEFEGALTDGSLFWMKSIHVHPGFRWQNIGVRLVAHTIATLSRSVHDVFVMQVMPIRACLPVRLMTKRRNVPSLRFRG